MADHRADLINLLSQAEATWTHGMKQAHMAEVILDSATLARICADAVRAHGKACDPWKEPCSLCGRKPSGALPAVWPSRPGVDDEASDDARPGDDSK